MISGKVLGWTTLPIPAVTEMIAERRTHVIQPREDINDGVVCGPSGPIVAVPRGSGMGYGGTTHGVQDPRTWYCAPEVLGLAEA